MAAHQNTLDENEIQEIRKVFVALNKDGDSGLSLEELSHALESISGSKPKFDEVQALMSVMDSDNDGKISWNEFVTTISSFVTKMKSGKDDVAKMNNLAHDSMIINSSGLNTSNITNSGANSKAQLHSNIANFFLQFRKSEDWKQKQARRLSISSKIQSVQASLTEQQIIDQKLKQESLKKCEKMSQNFPNAIASLHQYVGANDFQKTTECVKYLADTLSIMKVFHSQEVLYIGLYSFAVFFVFLFLCVFLSCFDFCFVKCGMLRMVTDALFLFFFYSRL